MLCSCRRQKQVKQTDRHQLDVFTIFTMGAEHSFFATLLAINSVGITETKENIPVSRQMCCENTDNLPSRAHWDQMNAFTNPLYHNKSVKRSRFCEIKRRHHRVQTLLSVRCCDRQKLLQKQDYQTVRPQLVAFIPLRITTSREYGKFVARVAWNNVRTTERKEKCLSGWMSAAVQGKPKKRAYLNKWIETISTLFTTPFDHKKLDKVACVGSNRRITSVGQTMLWPCPCQQNGFRTKTMRV